MTSPKCSSSEREPRKLSRRNSRLWLGRVLQLLLSPIRHQQKTSEPTEVPQESNVLMTSRSGTFAEKSESYLPLKLMALTSHSDA